MPRKGGVVRPAPSATVDRIRLIREIRTSTGLRGCSPLVSAAAEAIVAAELRTIYRVSRLIEFSFISVAFRSIYRRVYVEYASRLGRIYVEFKSSLRPQFCQQGGMVSNVSRRRARRTLALALPTRSERTLRSARVS